MYKALRRSGEAGLCRGGGSSLKPKQRAAARRLSLVAYLLFNEGREKNETSIRENLPAYKNVYHKSLGEDRDHDRAGDALRKLLARDVEALSVAGIKVEVEGEKDGRRYRLRPGGFSPVTLDLTGEERAVIVGALRALRRDFPYSGPLRLAVANLIGAASAGAGTDEDTAEERSAFAAVVTTGRDEEVSSKVGSLEGAVARRKKVCFDYYAISRDETTSREVEPHALSLLDGTWYMTGWDTGREAVRQFRLSRIRGTVVFATKKDANDFEMPENVEGQPGGPRAPWQLAAPQDSATIRLSQDAFAAACRKYPRAIPEDADENDGQRLVSTPYSGERQLAGYVLTLGDEALALSPPSLVERIEEGLGRIVRAHAPAGEDA